MASSNGLHPVLCAVTGILFAQFAANGQHLPNLLPFSNATGFLETYNTTGGPISLTGPFFQSLGTNGRSCVSCHRPAQGWSLSSDEVKLRFEITHGKIPFLERLTAPIAARLSTLPLWRGVEGHTVFFWIEHSSTSS
jgi:hypothetical protein